MGRTQRRIAQKFVFHTLLIGLAAMAFLPTLQAQYSTGLIIDDAEFTALPHQSDYGDGGKSEEKALSEHNLINLKPYCPTPKEQGASFSCAGWALGYAALSILANIQLERTDPSKVDENAFSAFFIYNQVRDRSLNCKSGTKISDGVHFLANNGNITHKSFDENSDCDKLPSEHEKQEAKKISLNDYMTLFTANDDEKIRVDKTKLSLIQKKPVVVALRIDKSFMNLTESDKFWTPPANKDEAANGHAVCVIGFDDGKGAFEIMNSWGEDWGSNGFIWIKYEDFATFAAFGVQMSIKMSSDFSEQKNQNKATTVLTSKISGEVILKKLLEKESDNTLVFDTEKVKIKAPSIYKNKNTIKKNSLYQILVKNLPAETYLYVFSHDNDKKTTIHFPKKTQKKDGGEVLNNALITLSETNLTLPNPTSAIQFKKKGKEQLIFLMSKTSIANFEKKVKAFSKTKTEIEDNLCNTFNINKNIFSQTKHENNLIKFENKIKNDEILPIVIELQIE